MKVTICFFLRYMTEMNTTCGKFCETKILYECQQTFIVFIITSIHIPVEQNAHLSLSFIVNYNVMSHIISLARKRTLILFFTVYKKRPK